MERQHIALTEAQIIAAEKGELQLEYRNGEKVCQLLWYKPPYRQYRNCVRTIHPDGEVHNHYKTGTGFQKSDYDLFVSEQAVDFSEPAEQVSPKPNIKDLTKAFLKVGEIGIFDGVEYLGCEESITDSCTGCDLYTANKTCGVKCSNTILKRVDASTEQLPKPLYEVGEIIEVREDDFSKWYEAEYLGGKNGQIAAWVGSCIDIFGEGNHRKKQTEKTVKLEGKVMTVKEAFKFLTNIQ